MLSWYLRLEGEKYGTAFEGFFLRGSGGSRELQTSKFVMGNLVETIETGKKKLI